MRESTGENPNGRKIAVCTRVSHVVTAKDPKHRNLFIHLFHSVSLPLISDIYLFYLNLQNQFLTSNAWIQQKSMIFSSPHLDSQLFVLLKRIHSYKSITNKHYNYYCSFYYKY